MICLYFLVHFIKDVVWRKKIIFYPEFPFFIGNHLDGFSFSYDKAREYLEKSASNKK